MNLALFIYLASIMTSLSIMLVMIGLFGLIIYFFILAVIHFTNYGIKEYSWEVEDVMTANKQVKDTYTKHWKKALIIFSLCFFLGILLPNKNTMYLMAAGYATEQIATSERAKNISNDVLEIIELKLKDIKKGQKHE